VAKMDLSWTVDDWILSDESPIYIKKGDNDGIPMKQADFHNY